MILSLRRYKGKGSHPFNFSGDCARPVPLMVRNFQAKEHYKMEVKVNIKKLKNNKNLYKIFNCRLDGQVEINPLPELAINLTGWAQPNGYWADRLILPEPARPIQAGYLRRRDSLWG